jgi:hypothetical protein
MYTDHIITQCMVLEPTSQDVSPQTNVTHAMRCDSFQCSQQEYHAEIPFQAVA